MCEKKCIAKKLIISIRHPNIHRTLRTRFQVFGIQRARIINMNYDYYYVASARTSRRRLGSPSASSSRRPVYISHLNRIRNQRAFGALFSLFICLWAASSFDTSLDLDRAVGYTHIMAERAWVASASVRRRHFRHINS